MKRHHGGLTASDPSLLVLFGTAELSHQRLAMPNVPAPQGQLWRSNIVTFRWLQHLGSGPVETAPTWYCSSDQIRFPWHIVLRFVAFSVYPIDSGVDLAMYARNHLPGAHSHVCSLLYFPLQPADAFSGHGL